MPGVAYAAGFMETMRAPMRTIQAQFTRSELHMLAWRSTEVVASMPKVDGPRAGAVSGDADSYAAYGQNQGVIAQLEQTLEPIADKLANKDGEIDLRKLTGNEALLYMNSLGFDIHHG